MYVQEHHNQYNSATGQYNGTTSMYVPVSPFPAPVGTALSMTFIPGQPMPQQPVSPPGTEQLISVHELNSFTSRLDGIFQTNSIPQWMRYFCYAMTFLCFFGFVIIGFTSVAAGPNTGGIIVCFIGFALFGVFMPIGMANYYKGILEREVRSFIEQANRECISRGYHWESHCYTSRTRQHILNFMAVYLVRHNAAPQNYPGAPTYAAAPAYGQAPGYGQPQTYGQPAYGQPAYGGAPNYVQTVAAVPVGSSVAPMGQPIYAHAQGTVVGVANNNTVYPEALPVHDNRSKDVF